MCSYKFVILLTDVPGVSYDALFDYTLNNIDVDFHNNMAGFDKLNISFRTDAKTPHFIE